MYVLLLGVWLLPSFCFEFGVHWSLGLSMGINKALNPPSYQSRLIDTARFREMVFNAESYK